MLASIKKPKLPSLSYRVFSGYEEMFKDWLYSVLLLDIVINETSPYSSVVKRRGNHVDRNHLEKSSPNQQEEFIEEEFIEIEEKTHHSCSEIGFSETDYLDETAEKKSQRQQEAFKETQRVVASEILGIPAKKSPKKKTFKKKRSPNVVILKVNACDSAHKVSDILLDPKKYGKENLVKNAEKKTKAKLDVEFQYDVFCLVFRMNQAFNILLEKQKTVSEHDFLGAFFVALKLEYGGDSYYRLTAEKVTRLFKQPLSSEIFVYSEKQFCSRVNFDMPAIIPGTTERAFIHPASFFAKHFNEFMQEAERSFANDCDSLINYLKWMFVAYKQYNEAVLMPPQKQAIIDFFNKVKQKFNVGSDIAPDDLIKKAEEQFSAPNASKQESDDACKILELIENNQKNYDDYLDFFDKNFKQLMKNANACKKAFFEFNDSENYAKIEEHFASLKAYLYLLTMLENQCSSFFDEEHSTQIEGFFKAVKTGFQFEADLKGKAFLQKIEQVALSYKSSVEMIQKLEKDWLPTVEITSSLPRRKKAQENCQLALKTNVNQAKENLVNNKSQNNYQLRQALARDVKATLTAYACNKDINSHENLWTGRVWQGFLNTLLCVPVVGWSCGAYRYKTKGSFFFKTATATKLNKMHAQVCALEQQQAREMLSAPVA